MQSLKLITILSLLLTSSVLFGHAQHAIPPSTDLMHLLAHYWPLLLAASVFLGLLGCLYQALKPVTLLFWKPRHDR